MLDARIDTSRTIQLRRFTCRNDHIVPTRVRWVPVCTCASCKCARSVQRTQSNGGVLGPGAPAGSWDRPAEEDFSGGLFRTKPSYRTMYNPSTYVTMTDHVSKGTRLVPSDCECRPTDIILSSRIGSNHLEFLSAPRGSSPPQGSKRWCTRRCLAWISAQLPHEESCAALTLCSSAGRGGALLPTCARRGLTIECRRTMLRLLRQL